MVCFSIWIPIFKKIFFSYFDDFDEIWSKERKHSERFGDTLRERSERIISWTRKHIHSCEDSVILTYFYVSVRKRKLCIPHRNRFADVEENIRQQRECAHGIGFDAVYV